MLQYTAESLSLIQANAVYLQSVGTDP